LTQFRLYELLRISGYTLLLFIDSNQAQEVGEGIDRLVAYADETLKPSSRLVCRSR
jgi:hypothetical protein